MREHMREPQRPNWLVGTVGTGLGLCMTWVPTVVLAATEAGAEKPDGGLPQLDFSTYPTQIFWLIVSFAILYWIMTKMAVPRIAEVLEERQERITDDRETAERLTAEAESVKAEYEQAVADARSKAQDQIRAINDELAQEQAKAEAEHAKKMARKTKTAETRIGKQRDEALENLKTVASEAAAEATQKLIGVAPDQAAVTKAVDAAAKEGRA